MKAMILAAGKGTRLRPLTEAIPKPLAPVANVPLIARTIGLLRAHGLCEIAVNLHHLPEALRAALGDGAAHGVSLRYSEEPELLGTAGGVGALREYFDRTFVVLYGDNYYDFDLSALIARHRESGARATIATFVTPNPTACGLIETDGEGRVTRFVEKPPAHEVFTDRANAGVYVLEPEVLEYVPTAGESDFGTDIFPRILSSMPGSLVAAPLNGYLRDTGTPENYRQANWDAVALHGAPALSPESRIDPAATLLGRNVVGAGCRVEPGATLEECVLWEGVRIGRGAVVRGAILGRNSAVGANATVGEGSLVADGARVPDGAILPPGAKLEPG